MFFLRLLILNLILTPVCVQADVYSFIDEAGVTHYSDIANDARYTLLLSTTPAQEPQVAISSQNPTHLSKSANNNPRALFEKHLSEAALANQLDAELLHAIITVESAYNPNARSPKGALGLMQLMPGTAKQYGVIDALDPVQNINGGAKYLRKLLTLFNNDLQLALAAYNSGEQTVIKYGNKIPPYTETMNYVPKVMRIFDEQRKINYN